MTRFGLIGAGLVGKKRAACLRPEQLVAVFDLDESRAKDLVAKVNHGRAATSPADLINDPEVEAVIISTRHDSLASFALQAIRAGRHVLIEKPAGRHPAELAPLLEAERDHRVRVRIGYNHRFHPALQEAHRIIDAGTLGPLMFMRGRYGHGGRVGYEKEWRAQAEISGGGELIDQGVHLIDLARWFFGDFPHVHGTTRTFFWNMAVDDNAFLELKTADGRVAWLHASCTEWKNLFSLEIYGRDGKLQIDGLGGSYGPERLIHYLMKPEMGVPDTTIREFPGSDSSWKLEMEEFEQDILLGRPPSPGLKDALAVLEIVDRIYRENGAAGDT
jgi:predicted dehydrogenase